MQFPVQCQWHTQCYCILRGLPCCSLLHWEVWKDPEISLTLGTYHQLGLSFFLLLHSHETILDQGLFIPSSWITPTLFPGCNPLTPTPDPFNTSHNNLTSIFSKSSFTVRGSFLGARLVQLHKNQPCWTNAGDAMANYDCWASQKLLSTPMRKFFPAGESPMSSP